MNSRKTECGAGRLPGLFCGARRLLCATKVEPGANYGNRFHHVLGE